MSIGTLDAVLLLSGCCRLLSVTVSGNRTLALRSAKEEAELAHVVPPPPPYPYSVTITQVKELPLTQHIDHMPPRLGPNH